MNGNWVESLKEAYGISEYVIAINIDIRGFTEFSQKVDSVDVAFYITRIYEKILENYFPNSSYSKPMGDGLFIIVNYDKDNLEEMVNNAVDNCLKLVDDFGTLLDADPMITFDVPDRVGIGITRGSACCIKTDKLTIDYSGKTLNHAARLMDKARPSGLVCDYKAFNDVIKPELKELFNEDAVCLRGISEKEPIKILYLKDKVNISIQDRIPIDEPIWHEERFEYDISVFKKLRRTFTLGCEKKIVSASSILVVAKYPSYREGERVKGIMWSIDYDISDSNISYEERGGICQITLQLKEIKEAIEKLGVPDDEKINLIFRYNI